MSKQIYVTVLNNIAETVAERTNTKAAAFNEKSVAVKKINVEGEVIEKNKSRVFKEDDIISTTINEQVGELAHIDMQSETYAVSPKCDMLYNFVRQHTIGEKLDPNKTYKVSLDFCTSPNDIIEDLLEQYNHNLEFVSKEEADILITESFRGPRATQFEEVSRISMFNAIPAKVQEELFPIFRGAYRNDLSQSVYSFETVDGTGSVIIHKEAVPMYEFLMANEGVVVLGLDNLYDFLNHDESDLNLLDEAETKDIIRSYASIINGDNISLLANILCNYDTSIDSNRHYIRKILFAMNEHKIELKKAYSDAIDKYADIKSLLVFSRTNMYKVSKTLVNHSSYDISDMLKPFIVWFDSMEYVARLFPEDRVEAILAEYKKVGPKFEPVKLVDDNIDGYDDPILEQIVIDYVKETLDPALVDKVMDDFKQFQYHYVLSQFAITFTFRDLRLKTDILDVEWI